MKLSRSSGTFKLSQCTCDVPQPGRNASHGPRLREAGLPGRRRSRRPPRSDPTLGPTARPTPGLLSPSQTEDSDALPRPPGAIRSSRLGGAARTLKLTCSRTKAGSPSRDRI
eukprot:755299-Hanusia_phi.AAC.9